jgi:hypothetical protein
LKIQAKLVEKKQSFLALQKNCNGTLKIKTLLSFFFEKQKVCSAFFFADAEIEQFCKKTNGACKKLCFL